MSSFNTVSNKTIIRVVKAIDFVEENLGKKLSLEEVAKAAYFSPYHFHRLFKIVTKETLNEFVSRKRLEKSAGYLLHQKEKTITEISELVGFTSLSSFSRGFKKFYGVSPDEFKKKSRDKFSKICKTKSKDGQVEVRFEQYIYNINNALNWIKMNAINTEAKFMPVMELAYISHQGKMNLIGNAYDELIKWATPRGVMSQRDLKMLTIYHDSPKITDPNKIRMSASVVLNKKVTTDGQVNLKTLPETKCIVSRFEVTSDEFQQAWESSFVWMSEQGYKRSERIL